VAEEYDELQKGSKMEDTAAHRGITMHQLPVGGNFPGLLFTVGTALVFLIAIPALWFVIAGAAAVGLAIAGVLQLGRRSPAELTSINPYPKRRSSDQRVLTRVFLK
jgi:hypothetical protein